MRKLMYMFCALALACSLIVTSKAEAAETGEVISVDGTTITVEVENTMTSKMEHESEPLDEAAPAHEATSSFTEGALKSVSENTSDSTEVIVLDASLQQEAGQASLAEQSQISAAASADESETVTVDLTTSTITVVSEEGPSIGTSSDIKEGSKVVVKMASSESTDHHSEHLPHEEQSSRRSRRESSQ